MVKICKKKSCKHRKAIELSRQEEIKNFWSTSDALKQEWGAVNDMSGCQVAGEITELYISSLSG
jgi:hypothetical protein